MKKISSSWFCIYTNPREEQIAFHELSLQGLDIYFPRYRRIVNHARKSQEKIFPLFPRYFFALENIDISFSSINRTRGVAKYIHQHDGSPVPIRQQVIDFIKSREGSCGYIQLNNQRFIKGDKIVLTNGIFANLSAIFLNQSDEERAKIILEFLGRKHVLPMPLDYLDRQN